MAAEARAGALPPVIGGILEAAIYADDLDAAEAFYGGLLGLRRIARGGNRHLFYAVGAGVLLIFNPAETEKPPGPGAPPVPVHGARGPGHVCFAVGATELEAVAQALRQAGQVIEADFRWPEGARSIYLRDPAGNSIEFADPALWGLAPA